MRVVALRALGMGDLLTAVPALRGLAREVGEVTLACPRWLVPLARRLEAVTAIAPIDELDEVGSTWPCDLAVNLHGRGPRSHATLHRRTGAPMWAFAHPVHAPDGPAWDDTEHERERWCRLLEHHGVTADPADLRLDPPPAHPTMRDRVVVHPGAKAASRRWPAERYAAVVRDLAVAGESVLVTAGRGEELLAREVAERSGVRCHVVAPDLAALDAIVANARLVVSGDTGIAHLALAYDRPSITLFGPTPASEWGPPPDPRHVALGNATSRARRRTATGGRGPDPALLAVAVRDVTSAATTLLR